MQTTTMSSEGEPLLPLPEDGLMQLDKLLQFVGMGETKFRDLMAEGKAPRPNRRYGRLVLWRVRDLRRFIEDPDAEWGTPS